MFVCAKNLMTRTLVVGTAEEALVQKVWADDVSFIAEEPAAFEVPRAVTVKAHYRQIAQLGKARALRDDAVPGGWRLEVTFNAPQRPCAPGQSLVLYDGETVLGGGTICDPPSSDASSSNTQGINKQRCNASSSKAVSRGDGVAAIGFSEAGI